MRTGANLVIQAMEEMPAFVSKDPRGFILRSAVPTRHALRMQGKVQTNKLIEFKLTDMQILFATLRDGGMAYG